jgi:hypothetical protein
MNRATTPDRVQIVAARNGRERRSAVLVSNEALR